VEGWFDAAAGGLGCGGAGAAGAAGVEVEVEAAGVEGAAGLAAGAAFGWMESVHARGLREPVKVPC